MREIKFRAWDEQTKRMWYQDSNSSSLTCSFVFAPQMMYTLVVAKDKCDDLMIPWQPIVERIKMDEKVKTIRDVEKVVLEYYAEGGW